MGGQASAPAAMPSVFALLIILGAYNHDGEALRDRMPLDLLDHTECLSMVFKSY